MSIHTPDDSRKVTTFRLSEMKERGEKISMLTAYDYTMAGIIDRAGIDVILVGDSASNVMAGNITTLPMTLDQMIYHGKSVMKAVKRALVVVDMPFGTYQGNSKEALASAIRIMKETHADCIKIEGGVEIIESLQRILTAGIPVMGHQIRYLRRACHRKGRSRETHCRRPRSGKSRLLCSGIGENTCGTRRASGTRTKNPRNRYRSR